MTILDTMEMANRILAKMNMENSRIENEKLYIEDTCIFTEGEVVISSNEHLLRRVESAIINSRMGLLGEALISERHYKMFQLSLED